MSKQQSIYYFKTIQEFYKYWNYDFRKQELIMIKKINCNPCKRITPFVEELSNDYKIKILVLDNCSDYTEENSKKIKKLLNMQYVPQFYFKEKFNHIRQIQTSNIEELRYWLLHNNNNLKNIEDEDF